MEGQSESISNTLYQRMNEKQIKVRKEGIVFPNQR
jgi:hypothetical protein